MDLFLPTVKTVWLLSALFIYEDGHITAYRALGTYPTNNRCAAAALKMTRDNVDRLGKNGLSEIRVFCTDNKWIENDEQNEFWYCWDEGVLRGWAGGGECPSSP